MAKGDKALRVRITGRVQGVFFRGWTQREAERRGLSGWVRNEDDGSVAALICGPPEAVEDLVAALRSGPSAARVDRVEVQEAEAAPHGDFRVLR